MGKRYSSAGSRVPVAMASVLIAVCIVGARLYSSSVASAGLAEQVSETCRSASALILPIHGDVATTEGTVREIAQPLVFVQPVRRGAFAKPLFKFPNSKVPQRLSLISLVGIETQVTPHLKPLAKGEIALSATNMFQMQLQIGQSFLAGGQELTVTQQFDDVPFAPLPEFWCAYPELFTPTSGGDPPPPSAIASEETIEAMGQIALVYDEYQITNDPITLTEAGELQAGYATVTAAWNERYSQQWKQLPRNELGSVLERARSVRTTVDRNLNPVLLIGLLADVVVLIAAGVLVARERRKELRLLAVRGVHPVRIALSVLPGLATSIVGGACVGFALAWTGVKLFGPSSLLETNAVVASVAQLVLAMLIATIVVAAVVATVADSYADPRRSRVGTRLPRIAAAGVLVAVAVVAFRRLDENGGVRSSGVYSKGGDLLAMGFPLFAMLAVIALTGMVVMGLAPRVRLTGKRLSRGVRLGWRRVVLEAGPLAAIVMSVALASGCFIVAIALSDGARLQLKEKSEVYVGTDLAVSVFGTVTLPPEWADQTSTMLKIRAKQSGRATDMLGVDPATFAEVTHLRGDGAKKSLDELIADINGDVPADGIPAIAVGVDAAVGDIVLMTIPGVSEPVSLHIVDTAKFFPGKKSTVPLYVMTSEQLAAAAPFPTAVLLINDPPADAIQSLRDLGVKTGLVLDAETSFDGSAYSALRWAYIPLGALGVLFAVVALSLQLLVITARREQRRIAHALMVRTGFRRTSAFMAAIVETGVPLVIGTSLGAVAAIGAASLSIVHLDPLPFVDPPARFLVPWSVLAGAVLIAVVWTVVIALAIVRSTERSDPMRVFHGAP